MFISYISVVKYYSKLVLLSGGMTDMTALCDTNVLFCILFKNPG
jgi:hypothetical protein